MAAATPNYIITKIERSGRQTDQEWDDCQRLKIKEHVKYARFNKVVPLGGDMFGSKRMAFDCAFMKMNGKLKDPAGYQIIGSNVPLEFITDLRS